MTESENYGMDTTMAEKELFPGATVRLLVSDGMDILAVMAIRPLDEQAQERLRRWFPNMKLVNETDFQVATHKAGVV